MFATKLILNLFLVLCLTTGQGASTIWKCEESSQPGVSGSSSEDWDILVLTQSWPPAACILLEGGWNHCNLTNLKSWTLHGLWPTKSGTEGPNFCNKSAVFDPSLIQVLQPRLGLNWPTVEKGENPDSLWSHEWCKHGTCGASLPALKDELHYFNTTLGLHDHFNLTTFLASARIIPSEETVYKYEDIMGALSKQIGSPPLLSCVRDKDNGKCYLEQVELCLTKSFEPTDCGRHARQTLSTGLNELLFQSERTFTSWGSRAGGGSSCSCESEDVYYMPLPSV